MTSAGHGRDAEVHEDDRLCHRRRQLDDALDGRLRLDGDVCFTELAHCHRAQHTATHAARPSVTLAISHCTASWTTVVLLYLTSMIIQPQTLPSSKHAAHYHPIIEDLYSEFYCGPTIKVGDLRSAVIRPSVSLPRAPISIEQ